MKLIGRANAWLFSSLPLGRVAAFRVVAYLFIFVDVLWLTPWVSLHGGVSEGLYAPPFIGRVLPFPRPTPGLVTVVEVLLLVAAAVALSGRLPRLAGYATAVLYFEWMMIAFSYAKVDHDRFAFLVALAVLPTVGRARFGDRTPSDSAGWALHCIQIGVVLTYFLSVYAKLRFGGVDWVNSATLARVVLRRGTFLADPLLDHLWTLHLGQYLIVAFELASPVMLSNSRAGRAMVWIAFVFHAVTYATIKIAFWSHVACLLTFLPLEKIRPPAFRRRRTFPVAQE